MKKRNCLLIMLFILVMMYGIGVYADQTQDKCGAIFGDLIPEIQNILNIVRIVAPIILLLLTSLDFAKVVFADSKDGLNKAKNNFLKRAVAILIIFFAPNIITLVLKWADDLSIDACIKNENNRNGIGYIEKSPNYENVYDLSKL